MNGASTGGQQSQLLTQEPSNKVLLTNSMIQEIATGGGVKFDKSAAA